MKSDPKESTVYYNTAGCNGEMLHTFRKAMGTGHS